MDLAQLDHAERCRLLDEETARVSAWLHGLGPAALDRPAHGDWPAREVIAHLVTVADFYAGNIERGVTGDHEAPPGRPAAGSMRGASTAPVVRKGAAAVAAATADDPLGAFDRSAARLSERLHALGPDQLDLPGYHPGGLLPLNRFLLLRAKELCVHEWDLRAPTDPAARISPFGVAAVLLIIDESIASGSLRWAYQPDPTVSAPLRVRASLDGAVRWQGRFTVTTDSIDMDPSGTLDDGAPADVTVEGDAEAFVRLVYGRLAPSPAGDVAGLRFDPAAVAPRAAGWFTGI
ncbi:MAG: maleylpyruvate isomerase N-terminal domain-containing protein [Acidimicrobiales bacterium]